MDQVEFQPCFQYEELLVEPHTAESGREAIRLTHKPSKISVSDEVVGNRQDVQDHLILLLNERVQNWKNGAPSGS